jgi:hypothetical protein
MKIRFYDPDDKPKTPPVSKGFTLTWERDLGWKQNPFTELTALPAQQYIVNQDAAREAANLFFIRSATFGTIRGGQGMGKTFFLTWLAEQLAAYGDTFLVYRFTGNSSVEDFTSALTKPYAGVFSRYSGETPQEFVEFVREKRKKQLVLLIDDADSLGTLEPYVRATVEHLGARLILTGIRPPALFPDTLNVQLTAMTPADALKLVEKRIAAVGGTSHKPFTPTFIKEVWGAANANPATFLVYCNETAMKIALKQVVLQDEFSAENLVEAAKTEEKPAKKTAKKTAKKKSAAKAAPETPKPVAKTASQYDDLISGLVK